MLVSTSLKHFWVVFGFAVLSVGIYLLAMLIAALSYPAAGDVATVLSPLGTLLAAVTATIAGMQITSGVKGAIENRERIRARAALAAHSDKDVRAQAPTFKEE